MKLALLAALLAAAPIRRTIVSRTGVAGSDEELQMILVEIAPGAAVPKHLHPVEGLNYIVSGTGVPFSRPVE